MIHFRGTSWIDGMKEYPDSLITFTHVDNKLMIFSVDEDSDKLDYNRIGIELEFTSNQAAQMIEFCSIYSL